MLRCLNLVSQTWLYIYRSWCRIYLGPGKERTTTTIWDVATLTNKPPSERPVKGVTGVQLKFLISHTLSLDPFPSPMMTQGKTTQSCKGKRIQTLETLQFLLNQSEPWLWKKKLGRNQIYSTHITLERELPWSIQLHRVLVPLKWEFLTYRRDDQSWPWYIYERCQKDDSFVFKTPMVCLKGRVRNASDT